VLLLQLAVLKADIKRLRKGSCKLLIQVINTKKLSISTGSRARDIYFALSTMFIKSMPNKEHQALLPLPSEEVILSELVNL
jgi:hypothetical protein